MECIRQLALSDHLTLASTWICRMVCFWECPAIIWPIDPSGFLVGSMSNHENYGPNQPFAFFRMVKYCYVLLQGVNWIIDGWESMMERGQKTYICFVYVCIDTKDSLNSYHIYLICIYSLDTFPTFFWISGIPSITFSYDKCSVYPMQSLKPRSSGRQTPVDNGQEDHFGEILGKPEVCCENPRNLWGPRVNPGFIFKPDKFLGFRS